jgi:excisionase family DNA binding protein
MTPTNQKLTLLQPGTASDARLLTVSQAAQYLAISASTLYGWVWQRRIPFVKVGRAVRFDLRELEQFIESSRVKPRSNGKSESERTRNCYNTRAAGKG